MGASVYTEPSFSAIVSRCSDYCVIVVCVCVLLSAHFLLLGLLPHCRADNAFGLMDRTETKRTFLLTLILSWRSKHGHMML